MNAAHSSCAEDHCVQPLMRLPARSDEGSGTLFTGSVAKRRGNLAAVTRPVKVQNLLLAGLWNLSRGRLAVDAHLL